MIIPKRKKIGKQLTKKGDKLLSDFDVAARTWGWESDQGVGKAVDNAERNYKETRQKLERYLLLLEGKVYGEKGNT